MPHILSYLILLLKGNIEPNYSSGQKSNCTYHSKYWSCCDTKGYSEYASETS
nr:MAG TPA: hypothetical protein [Caudoviricetes sp.]